MAKILREWAANGVPIGETCEAEIYYVATPPLSEYVEGAKVFLRRRGFANLNGWEHLTIEFTPAELDEIQSKVVKSQRAAA